MNSMQVKCLISLGNTKSITKTANQLFVSQSTVSKNIKRLEEELGIQIISVRSHRTHLTDDGVYLWRNLQILDGQFNQVLEHIYSDQSTQPIVICHSITAFEKSYLPLFMQSFNNHHKQKVKLAAFHPDSYENSVKLLLQETANFILVQEDFFHNDPRIAFTPLLRGRYSVIISSKNPLAKKKVLSLKDLNNQNLSIWNSTPPVNSVSQLIKTIHATVENCSITEVKSVTNCEIYAASGEGFGIVPSFAYDHHNGDVVYNFLDVDLPINYGISYLHKTAKENYFKPVVRDLTRAIKYKQRLWS